MNHFYKIPFFAFALLFLSQYTGIAQSSSYNDAIPKVNLVPKHSTVQLNPNDNVPPSKLLNNGKQHRLQEKRMHDVGRSQINHLYDSLSTRPRFSKHIQEKYMTVQSNPAMGSNVLTDSVQPAWSRLYGAALESVSDYQNDATVDQYGNIYVTGNCNSSVSNWDYLTVKYDHTGKAQWVARYSSPGYGEDVGLYIALDNAGNVYVSGITSSSSGDYDYTTIKYNSLGVEQWVAQYNGTGDSDDVVTDMAVDKTGNVYVTGGSYTTGNIIQFVTVKYNTTGTEQWVRSYNGNESYIGLPSSVAVDSTGNVFVAASDQHNQPRRITTIKYSSSGEVQWKVIDDNDYYSSSYGIDIVVDKVGNSYVAGVGYSNTAHELFLSKYNSLGELQWRSENGRVRYVYTSSNILAVDNLGNSYIVGCSFVSDSITAGILVKYNSSGTEDWAVKDYQAGYTGTQFKGVAIDSTGNIYINAWNYISYRESFVDDFNVIKYSKTGGYIWQRPYNREERKYHSPNTILADNVGNIVLSGYSYSQDSDFDLTTVKYNSSGTEVWADNYDSPVNVSDDAPNASTTDAVGNVYVTGYCRTATTRMDMQTIKYNTAGVLQWVARYNGPGNYFDQANDIVVDGMGNVYITGYSANENINSDFTTIKYNSAGVQQWIATYNGTGNSEDIAWAMAFDQAGNIIITGSSIGNGTGYDIVTIKYDPAGHRLWSARCSGGLTSSEEYPFALTIDRNDNIFITGYCDSGGTESDYFTVKYNSQGIEQWRARYDGPQHSFDMARDLVVDSYGAVYVTGFCRVSLYGDKIITIKYSPTGVQEWVSFHSSPNYMTSSANAIAIDSANHIYVTGKSYSNSSYDRCVTIRYGMDGEELWANHENSPNPLIIVEGTDIVVDGSGNVYVTGYCVGSPSREDIVTVKYNLYGERQWQARFTGPNNSEDKASSISLDKYGNVYVTGTSSEFQNSWFVTLKYQVFNPKRYSISQNYPNPFNAGTTFEYKLTVSGVVSLKIYDILGREVATLLNEPKQPGLYKQHWDAGSLATGVYLYRLQIGDFIEMKKLLLLK